MLPAAEGWQIDTVIATLTGRTDTPDWQRDWFTNLAECKALLQTVNPKS